MKKKLGLFSAVCICVGLIVATSCLLSLGTGIGLAGKSFILPMFIVVIINSLLALTLSELHNIMPGVEGGLGQYTLVGLGPVASIVSNLSAYVVTNMLAGAAEMAMCGYVLHLTFLPMVSPWVIATALLLILMVINWMGVDMFAKIQNVVVVLLIGSFIVLGLMGTFRLGTGEAISAAAQTTPVVSGIGGLISLSALAFWLFIGIEFIIPVSKDIKNPRKIIPLAMIISLVLLFVVQSLLGNAMGNYVSFEELSTSTMPHLIFAENMLGKVGSYWIGIVTMLAGVSTINTVLGSVTRILSGMAEAEMLPSVFAKKNKFDTPVAGIILIGGTIAFIVISGLTESSGLTPLLLAASCFWLTSYILVCISTLILRKKYPEAVGRNKKLNFAGIPQIIVILGNIFMIWNIAEGDTKTFIYRIYVILLIVMLVYAVGWIKFIKKASLLARPSLDEINEKSLIREDPVINVKELA
ncbi:MAG: APC family permease [Lachnospiraceae bacterium]